MAVQAIEGDESMKEMFEEIVGYEDIKKELRIISDMINNPEVYKDMGAKMERGMILYGKPGTGKTTMAKSLIRSTDRKCFTVRKKASDLHNAFEMAAHLVDDFCSYGFHNWIQDKDNDFSSENRNRAMAMIISLRGCPGKTG